MMRRKETCNRGQMLVTVAAGGGVGPPVSASHRLPHLDLGESNRWSPEVLAPVSKMLLQAVWLTLPPSPEGNMPMEHRDTGLHCTATRVKCLQRGVALLSLSTTNTLLPPHGCVHQLQLCSDILPEWRHFFIQTNHVLSQGLAATTVFKLIRLHGSSSLSNENESESVRCHLGRFLHTDEKLCYPQGALWVMHAD